MFFKERWGVSLFHEPIGFIGWCKGTAQLDPEVLGHLQQMQKPEIQTDAEIQPKLPDSNISGAEGQDLEGIDRNLISGAAENQTAVSNL